MLKSVKVYDPVGSAIWGKGQAAPYLHVSRALAAMDSTTKRLRISDVIANMFRSLLAMSPGESSFGDPTLGDTVWSTRWLCSR